MKLKDLYNLSVDLENYIVIARKSDYEIILEGTVEDVFYRLDSFDLSENTKIVGWETDDSSGELTIYV